MDASFGLGASTYQIDMHMSLLNDSLALVDNSKTPFIKYKNNFSVEGEVSITEKMHCFNRLVFEQSLRLEDLCSGCLSDFIKVSHFSQKKYESFAENYEENVLMWDSTSRGSSSSVNTPDRSIALSLLDEVKQLQNEYDALLQEEKEADDQLQLLIHQELDCDQQLSDAMKSLNILQYHSIEEKSKLGDQYIVSISAEQEVHLLSLSHFSPLFKWELLALPSRLAHLLLPSLQPLLHSHRGYRDSSTGNVVLAINGFRISFVPQPEWNLNWAEINVAWSNLCTAFVSYQQLLDTSFGKTAAPPSAPPAGLSQGQSPERTERTESRPPSRRARGACIHSFSFSYEVLCLRHTGVLVESPSRSAYTASITSHRTRGSGSGSGSTRLPAPQSYCLSCSAHSRSSSSSLCGAGSRGSADEYLRAILALALGLIEVLVLDSRRHMIASFPTLHFLFAHATAPAVPDMDEVRGHAKAVPVLEWPSLEQLLQLLQMSTEDHMSSDALANEVLLACHLLLVPSSSSTSSSSYSHHSK